MRKRIIPVVLIDAGGKSLLSRKFDPWRTVGMLMQSLRLHDQRGADELLILDTSATKENRIISGRIFKTISDNVRVPITIGGGIRNLSTAKHYINCGADKISLNSSVIDDIKIVRELASSLGSQAVVVNINYKWSEGRPWVYDYRYKSTLSIELSTQISNLLEHGVGELVITSVDRDGCLNGFDQALISYLDQIGISVPVVISGGGGHQDHYVSALSQNISAVTGGTIFSLTENTPKTLRSFCEAAGIPMRRE